MVRGRGGHSHIRKALLDFVIGGFTESEKGDKFKNWCLSHIARSSSKDFLWKGSEIQVSSHRASVVYLLLDGEVEASPRR